MQTGLSVIKVRKISCVLFTKIDFPYTSGGISYMFGEMCNVLFIHSISYQKLLLAIV